MIFDRIEMSTWLEKLRVSLNASFNRLHWSAYTSEEKMLSNKLYKLCAKVMSLVDFLFYY